MSLPSEEGHRTWSPRWAPHVVGRWKPIEEDDEGTWVFVACAKCGEDGRHWCPSGVPHMKVQKFASLHAHGGRRW